MQVQLPPDVSLRAAAAKPRQQALEEERERHGATPAAREPSRLLDDEIDRAGEPLPRRDLPLQMRAPGGRQRVELRLPAGLGRGPLAGDPVFLLQAVEGRIQRALLHLEDVTPLLAREARCARSNSIAARW